jgi:hypothetical protein
VQADRRVVVAYFVEVAEQRRRQVLM